MEGINPEEDGSVLIFAVEEDSKKDIHLNPSFF
jgi:hypothetical protein